MAGVDGVGQAGCEDHNREIVMYRLVPALLLLAACAPAAPDGAQLYARHCAACHGATGAGDGPEAARLPVPPADLRNLAASNGGQFPTGAVMATIHGYPGKSHLGAMPEFSALLGGETVAVTTTDGRVIAAPRALVELAVHVETLQTP
ncbi:c-type cytochrome [Ruegeria pomeroyi]|nr:c-type cytochrome [Ruegeria pomeroyi]